MSVEYYLQNVDMTIDQQVSDEHDQIVTDDPYINCEADVGLSELNLVNLGISGNAAEEGNPEEKIIFFRVNGSEEVYGIQKVVDEDGKEKKCQFQVRQTSDGQFEPIPESIQLLHSNEEYVENNDHSDIGPIYFKEEYLVVDESQGAQNELVHDTTIGPDEEDLLGILLKNDNAEQSSNEPIDFEEDYLPQPNFSDLVQEATSNEADVIVEDQSQKVYLQDPLEGYGNQLLDEVISPVIEDEQSIVNNIVNAYVDEPSNDENSHLMVEDIPNAVEEQIVESEIYLRSLSKEVYGNPSLEELISQAVEDEQSIENNIGTYVEEPSNDVNSHLLVGDIPNAAKEQIVDNDVYLGSLSKQLSHLVQQTVSMSADEDDQQENYNSQELYNNALCDETRVFVTDEDNKQYSYVVKSSGKENVAKPTYKVNPRSVLKSSVLRKKAVMKPVQKIQTKIIEAPVRTKRLPRKQKIEPIMRSGEEIVLQEIVVSSTGYIRITEDGVLRQNKKIVPKEYVQLSDSDEDGRYKKRRKKGKKRKYPPVAIIISDSEE